MDAVALGGVAHGRVLEAEAGGAALWVLGVQVKEAPLTPEGERVPTQGLLSKHAFNTHFIIKM